MSDAHPSRTEKLFHRAKAAPTSLDSEEGGGLDVRESEEEQPEGLRALPSQDKRHRTVGEEARHPTEWRRASRVLPILTGPLSILSLPHILESRQDSA